MARENAAHVLVPMLVKLGYDERNIVVSFRKEGVHGGPTCLCCWTAREVPENYTGMNKGLSVLKWLAVVLVLVLAVWAVLAWRRGGGVDVQVGFDPRIELTAQEISRIERIGQWEFLSVQSEVVADTLRKGFSRTTAW